MSKSFPQSFSPETELTISLLSPEQNYPWNPADPETESYYLHQEELFNLNDWSEDDLQQSTASFFAQLHSYWPSESFNLVNQLRQKFAARVPAVLLEKVAAAVVEIAHNQTQAANQLVSCVQELLPTWEEADLLLLTRPYRYAMRCDPDTDNINNLARSIDWLELSEVEQAKLTILVTQYAMDQMADQTPD
jgi:hypothetical protein